MVERTPLFFFFLIRYPFDTYQCICVSPISQEDASSRKGTLHPIPSALIDSCLTPGPKLEGLRGLGMG